MKYIIYKSEDGQYYYSIVSGNGKVMMVSETMRNKRSCEKAIKTIQTKAAHGKVLYAE